MTVVLNRWVGDLNEGIQDQLLVGGAVYNFTGAGNPQLRVRLFNVSSWTVLTTVTWQTISTGIVQYAPQSSDPIITTAGRYIAQWYVPSMPSGNPQAGPLFEIVVADPTGATDFLTQGVGSVRTGMAWLIGRARQIIGDTNPASYVFADGAIQNALDIRRTDVRYVELYPDINFQQTGPVQWFNYFDVRYGGNWEVAGASDPPFITNFQWQDLNGINPYTFDYQTGKCVFSASQTPPVFLTGRTFDIYTACGDLLTDWARQVKLDFDFAVDRSPIQRSQKYAMLMDAAKDCYSKGRPRPIHMVRSDVIL